MESVFSWFNFLTTRIPPSSMPQGCLWGFGISKGFSFGAPWRLRHCTTLFTMRLHPWSLPTVGNGGGKRQFITPGHPSDAGGNLGKRVWLTRETRPDVSSSRASNAEEVEKIARPLPPEEWRGRGEVGVPRNLFPRIGVG